MKNTLGKILFLSFFTLILSANTDLATYKFSTNVKNPTIKQAVEIKFEANQKDKRDVMFFFLEPIASEDYKMVLLKKDEKDLSYHNKKGIFTFLLFPLKAKKIAVNFKFTIKIASDDAVAEVYKGSRDNVKWISTTNTDIKLKPLILDVKKLKNNVDLVGDFEIDSKLKSDKISAYESANIIYYLHGTGFDEFDISPIEKQNGVKIFSDITKHFNYATKDGYIIKREFNYALVSDKDIKIKSQNIKCYSPKRDKYYTLNTKAYDIKVKKLNKSSLIDKEEYPKSIDYFSYIKQFFIYFIVFISGYLSAILIPKYYQRRKILFKDIRDSKDAKELLYILMHSYSNYELAKYYDKLEEIVYNKNKILKFKDIKKEILDTLT